MDVTDAPAVDGAGGNVSGLATEGDNPMAHTSAIAEARSGCGLLIYSLIPCTLLPAFQLVFDLLIIDTRTHERSRELR
jgi:hypothetical protein